jgi:hypothetical protein
MPPRLTIHIGDLVTSTNLTGSQKPIGIPGTGTGIPGLGQKHNIFLDEFVSAIGLPTIFTPPIVIGNKHFQHISVIGLTNLPTQPTDAYVELDAIMIIIHIVIHNISFLSTINLYFT